MTIPSGIRNWSLHIILIWKTRLDDYIGSKYLHKINSVQSIHICIFLANSVPWNSQAKFLIYIWIILNFQKVDNMAKFLSVQLNRKNIRFNWFGTKIAKITIVDIYGMPICQSLCMDFLIPSSFFFFAEYVEPLSRNNKMFFNKSKEASAWSKFSASMHCA